jgi:hypothetical protein
MPQQVLNVGVNGHDAIEDARLIVRIELNENPRLTHKIAPCAEMDRTRLVVKSRRYQMQEGGHNGPPS